jgi:glycosyltransferase involved in cell wall biosynthesis
MPGATGSGGRAAGGGLSVLVDARGLRSSGIGRYLREVLAHLFHDARFGRWTMLGGLDEVRTFAAEHGAADRVQAVSFPHPFYSPAAQVHWLALAARGALRADAAFFPHYDVPVAGPAPPSVVTVHDLAHFLLPDVFPAWKRAVAGGVLRRAVGRARRVVVISRATRDDLVGRIPAAAGKAVLIPQGVAPAFGAAVAAEPRTAEVHALRPFLLCVGNRKPHKNLVAAVDALAELRRDDPALRLVIAGARFPEGDGVGDRARELGVADAVVELDACGDAELRALYGAAECLVFPSLFEGFGLPVLEAMAAGLPAVVSSRGPLPEVAGDAGVVVDPRAPGAIAAAVRRLRAEPRFRAECVARGRARAGAMTWAHTAERTGAVLREVAAGR